jgi:hypothetical protein
MNVFLCPFDFDHHGFRLREFVFDQVLQKQFGGISQTNNLNIRTNNINIQKFEYINNERINYYATQIDTRFAKGYA